MAVVHHINVESPLEFFFAKVPMTKTHKEKIIALLLELTATATFFWPLQTTFQLGPGMCTRRGRLLGYSPISVTSRALGPPLGGG